MVPPVRLTRMLWAAGLMLGLFAIAAGLGLYEAGLHRGTSPTAVGYQVSVSGGRMTPSTWKAQLDDQVVLSIVSDRSQTLSISGYGISYHLSGGAPVAATFLARRAGSFDIRVDGSKVGVLQVS